MGIVYVLFVLVVIGVLLWAFNTYVTACDAKLKTIINVFVVICVVLWLLNLMGVFGLVNIPVPRVHQ